VGSYLKKQKFVSFRYRIGTPKRNNNNKKKQEFKNTIFEYIEKLKKKNHDLNQFIIKGKNWGSVFGE